MIANYFISSLAQTLTVGGKDTQIALSTIYTQDGQIISTSDFAQFGRGVFTINPSSLTNVEFASFTTVDPTIGSNGGVSGVVRGLSFKGNNQIAANQKFNVIGTPVIISFGTHNIQDIMDTINNIVINNSTLASITQMGISRLSSSSDVTIGVATISIASPAVITFNSHGLTAGDTIKFTTTGTLPTGILPNTTYYVISSGLGTNVFEVSLTAGGAAINTSGTQTGIHTLIKNTPTAIGVNDTRLPTTAQQAALVGSQGVLSATNKFVTQDNVYDSDTDQVQTTQNGTVVFGDANTTGNKNKIAQSFIPTKTKTRGVKLYKIANTGTYTGDVTVALYADTAGSPSGSALATVTLTNAVYNALAVGEFEADFSAEYSMTAGTLYWIMISSSTADSSNHPNLGTNTAGGYANGSVKYWNTTDGYVAIANIDLYFKTLQGVVSQIGYISAVPVVRTYLNAASPATWTKPAGLKYIDVEVQAGGGGSGGTNTGSGGGGGGGGYSKKTIAAGTLGATETVTIGAAGAGAAAWNNNGAAGGNSSFGTHATANGGSGVNASNRAGGAGGTASSGNINISGGGGFTGIGYTNSYCGGTGGSSVLGSGGLGTDANSSGTVGSLYGGGGGGGATNSGTNGGGSSGAAGIVIVTEYYY